ncbi:PEP-CTERM sorting domain-containing protein [Roseibacillus ishigakijimensis]|uniref:PEP-CTERM sorting domain-containing protein n=1 Tax=Roseibacillus ishigakijimensis TaxID=454146 RepID=A0A934RQ81_9BACT|nr:PEP-CTERM sorting domain-containing protein [Roseibacillus ishigakijimensis]MBK1834970.1 PEP-CTERM sorting domain-containing protein [Roseibacillus ishigakijimensis]
MKIRKNLSLGSLLGFFWATSAAPGATTLVSANRYAVNEGVAFTLANSGASDFLFSWTDSSGTTSGTADPYLILTVGQTYTFQRTSSAHPFLILTTNLAVDVSGGDGFFSRTAASDESSEIDPHILRVATLGSAANDPDNFRADPGPTTDLITWTPTMAEVGDYFYTCQVPGHSGMTGGLTVVPEPSSIGLLASCLTFLTFRRRRC